MILLEAIKYVLNDKLRYSTEQQKISYIIKIIESPTNSHFINGCEIFIARYRMKELIKKRRSEAHLGAIVVQP